MNANVEETVYLSFICPSCRQEIEAPADLAGQETECPACAAPISVPAESEPDTLWGVFPASHGGLSPAQIQAMKSRTIRIELDASW
jgi:DNA-directed RNA polymerase subunit RPC12/RpoP